MNSNTTLEEICPVALRPRVLEQGLYLAHIHDDLFELEVPADFQPRRFDRPVQPA